METKVDANVTPVEPEAYYLREFDFYPESLTLYRHREELTDQFWEEVKKGQFLIFTSKYEALCQCFRVREILGMKNDYVRKELAQETERLIGKANNLKSQLEAVDSALQTINSTVACYDSMPCKNEDYGYHGPRPV